MLETIARQMDKTDRCHAEHPVQKWMAFLAFKREKPMVEFLEFCANFGRNSGEIPTKFGKITMEYVGNIIKIGCPKLLELKDEYSKRSGQYPDTSREFVPNKNKEVRSKKEDREEYTLPLESSAREKKSPENAFKKIYEVGVEIFPHLEAKNTHPINRWIEAGCDPNLDVIETLKGFRGRNVRTWAYFDAAVLDAKAQRESFNHQAKNPTGGKNHERPTKDDRAKRALREAVYGDDGP